MPAGVLIVDLVILQKGSSPMEPRLSLIRLIGRLLRYLHIFHVLLPRSGLLGFDDEAVIGLPGYPTHRLILVVEI